MSIKYAMPIVQYCLWQWKVDGNCNLVAGYPEINIGKKPWTDSDTEKQEASDWPKKYEDLSKFTCDIDFNCTAEGRYNTAFEFWLLKNEISNRYQYKKLVNRLGCSLFRRYSLF